MNDNTITPETDEIWDNLCDSWCNWSVDYAHEELLEKCRELEMERDEARQLTKHYRDRCYDETYKKLPWEKPPTP